MGSEMCIRDRTSALLAVGIEQSAKANNAIVALKVTILVLFIGVGALYVVSNNWDPFIPGNEGGFGDFGASGVLRAAGLVFFAYVGFDAVATASAESRDPRRTVPIGLLATVAISTILYVGIGLVMTGMVPFDKLNVANPISAATDAYPSLDWLGVLVDISAVIGLASTVLVTFYGQTRIFMRMGSDGMLPDRFGEISKKTSTPVFATAVTATAGAIAAGFIPLSVLGQLISIGTLLAFLIVCAGVLTLRRTRPDLERPFRVPAVWLVAPLGIVYSLALMATLPIDTWLRLLVWLVIGLVIFFTYSRTRAIRRREEVLSGARQISTADADA